MGIPWRSSGVDSVLSLTRAWVQLLVAELRSCKPHGVAKKKMVLKNNHNGMWHQHHGGVTCSLCLSPSIYNSKTCITQQRCLCSTHKHATKFHTSVYLKVAGLKHIEEVEPGEQYRRYLWSQTPSHSWLSLQPQRTQERWRTQFQPLSFSGIHGHKEPGISDSEACNPSQGGPCSSHYPLQLPVVAVPLNATILDTAGVPVTLAPSPTLLVPL